MTRVKEAIEEMIEESYLLGLTEQQIRADFKRFIDTCYAVIEENVQDREAVTDLTEDLAREQTVILIADRAEGSELPLKEKSTAKSPEEEFSERAARRKRQILRIIAEFDPQLVRLIDEHRFQGELDMEPASGALTRRSSWRFSWRPDWQRIRLQLLKVGYATTIGIIVLLIYLGFLQS